MRELTIKEMEIVSGGVDWGEVGAGFGAIATGAALLAISPEVGAITFVAAAAAIAFGGFAVGDGMVEGHAFGGADGDGE